MNMRWLTIAACACLGGCAASADPNAKYRDVQLTVGLPMSDIKTQFGEPDSYREYWNERPVIDTFRSRDERSAEHRHHVEILGYGPFGAHRQTVGHITKYRLNLSFIDGQLKQ